METSPNKFYTEVKCVRLKIHPRNFSSEDVIVNFDWFSKEKFQLINRTVIEIFPIEEKKSKDRRNHLLLEVKHLPLDLQSKGGPLSISQEVAAAFGLLGAREACIRRVDRQHVALDLVEFRFKDQVLSRSDMWRFTNSLIEKGMFVSRKVQFAGMLLRVSELWAQGDRVMSGVVVDTSRVVFRSASCQMFVFIQVSREMWEFDPNGDMYVDKAVDGFLRDLFSKWKEKDCNHEVTLILFARKFYQSPEHLEHAAVMRDKRGHCYEDFYKVITEKECRADWLSAIVEVKRGLKQFQSILKPRLVYKGEESECKEWEESECEEGEWISPSSEGNILEAMNLAVNVLENHYKEVSFSTTGQQIVIVSPGVGVFEVDHQMNLLTRERIIDNGIGADLVCLNEQPLHSVPLFKFHQSDVNEEDRYHIPHWINYSFYNPPRPWNKSRFQPRIIVSDHLINKHLKARMAPRGSLKPIDSNKKKKKFSLSSPDPNDPLSRAAFDYDEYDANIFSSVSHQKCQQGARTIRKIRSVSEELGRGEDSPDTIENKSPDMYDTESPQDTSSTSNSFIDQSEKKKMFFIRDSSPQTFPVSPQRKPIVQPRARHLSDNYDENEDVMKGNVHKSGSAENVCRKNKPVTHHRKKPLINPFDPKKAHVEEVSSHNCRWTHTFPRDREGNPFQRHHKSSLKSVDEDKEMRDFEGSMNSSNTVAPVFTAFSSPVVSLSSETVRDTSSLDNMLSSSGHNIQSKQGFSPIKKKKVHAIQNFSAVRRVGMDWTSFVEPACLPLTTDFYPEDSVLTRDYTDYPTNLVVNAIFEETEGSKVSLGWRSDHQNMSTIQAFKEMISQRLLQGFQLVFKDGSLLSFHHDLQELQEIISGKNKKKKEKEVVVKFSLGRVFLRIDLNAHLNMLAHIFRSKHPLGVNPFNYQYHLVINNSTIVQHSSLHQVGMDGYNWNYVDQHICGHQDFENYQNSNKYWRCRYVLLPMTPPPYEKCGEDQEKWLSEMVSEFIKLSEFLNHIKRTPPGMPNKVELSRFPSLPVSPFPRTYSRSPSPTPTPKRNSDNESYRRINSPLRSITEPMGVGGLYQKTSHRNKPVGMRRARSREDVSLFGTGHDRGRELPRIGATRTPQPYSSKSVQLRHGNEAISDLKQLTFDTDIKTAPDSISLGTRTPFLPSPRTFHLLDKEDEDHDCLPPPFNIIPVDSQSNTASVSSSVLSVPRQDLESSLEYSRLSEEGDDELYVDSYPELVVKKLFGKDEGVDTFKLEKKGSVSCCYGKEAVDWVMERMQVTRREAFDVLERAFSENLITHASGDRRIPLIDGCYMYCKTTAIDRALAEVDWESYKKKWFEVSVIHLVDILMMVDSGGGGGYSNISSRTSSFMSSLNSSPYYMHQREKSRSMPVDFFNRYLELNPDTQKKSDRPEWCYLRYSNRYNPVHAYEVEFQWMVATASLLNEMIQGLVHKASMCSFNFIPVLPLNMLRLSDSGSDRPHPFYHPLKIPLIVPTKTQGILKEKGYNISEFLTQLFQLIIQKFGFLVDPSSVSGEMDISEASHLTGGGQLPCLPTKQVFVHYSGCALIQPWFDLAGNSSSGFYWYRNHYYLNQKTTQSSVVAKHDELFQEFSQFCRSEMDEAMTVCLENLKQHYYYS